MTKTIKPSLIQARHRAPVRPQHSDSFSQKLTKRNKDRVSVVIKSSLGSLTVLNLTEKVCTSLINNEPMPAYFLSGSIAIQEYMIADDLVQFLGNEFGFTKAEHAVKRLKMYLESCKTATKTTKVVTPHNRKFALD